MTVELKLNAAAIVHAVDFCPIAEVAIEGEPTREPVVGADAEAEIPSPAYRVPDDFVKVEVDDAYREGRFSHELVREAEHAVEDVGAGSEGVNKDIGRPDAFCQRVDAVRVPEGLGAIGGIRVHLDLDVRELPLAEFRIDFNVAEVTLSHGDHREGAPVHADHHARKLQVGVQLFRKPLAFHLLVQLLDIGFEKASRFVR